MEQLPALNKELGYPATNKLYAAAQRAGLRVTIKQVQEFVSKQNVRQVFHKLPPSNGKIVASDINDAWVADLIDYTSRPSEGKDGDGKVPFQYILIVQDVFSRRIMALPIRDKLPETCKNAFESIVNEREVKPTTLSTDLGSEFKGPFDEYLTREEIYHRLKDPRSLNSQGTLDAAIRAFRPMLARIQAEEGTRNWAAEVQRAVKAYNSLEHSHLRGRAPSEVEGDGGLRFHLTKEAAEGFQRNSDIVQKRDAKIAAAGHFREQLQPRKFHKVMQTTYSDTVHAVQSVSNNQITDTHGNVFTSRHTLAVPQGSGPINTGGLSGGSAPIDAKRVASLDPFKAQILQYVGAGKWEFEVAAHMKTIGMADLMKNGLNYRKALLLLGFAVDGRGKVTPIPVPILPAAGPVVAPRMRIHIKRAPRDDERPSMMP
jgi:hypothetical protein